MLKGWTFNFPWRRSSSRKIKKVVLGICAMDKKARSKPMNEILSRLPEDLFEIVVFGDDCILNQPVENWPTVEVLITFFSTRFPTNKALQYISLRKPFLINDLSMETTLKDRRKVYDLMASVGIDVPPHIYVNRIEGEPDTNVIEEFDEYIVVNGVQMNKPFVEKPIDAEDHNIYIYYPVSAGGGSKRLFRKVDDRSSEFYPGVNDIRREGSFIYEEFVITQGTDVKVYTVGPEYAHAEARKSPVVDGRVKRDSEGCELRYPVILSPAEKEMARKIVVAFRQTVCGFDLLRVHGKSYCCDVNGFSFVKNSRKYYEDASQILAEIMLSAVRREANSNNKLLRPIASLSNHLSGNNNSSNSLSTPSPGGTLSASAVEKRNHRIMRESSTASPSITSTSVNDQDDGRPPSPTPSLVSDTTELMSVVNIGHHAVKRYETEELRCVIAVIRHGDRTPKQKMKVVVSVQQYLDYFHSYAKTPKKDLKVKSKSGLLQFLDVTKKIIADSTVPIDLRRKLTQLKDVLERWEISGLNRKLQMKPQKWDEDEEILHETSQVGLDLDEPSLSRKNETAVRRKGTGLATEVLVILKWGGDLTPLGREQAEHLGAQFRTEYYPDHDNGGVLRLHATYRHDLKIKASDEGRVMKTAAAFTKGLLELEGQLTPILASLVTIEEKNRTMLDSSENFEMKQEMERCKTHLNLLQVDEDISDALIDVVAPGCSPAIRAQFQKLGNPLQSLKRIYALVENLVNQLKDMVEQERQALAEAAVLAGVHSVPLQSTSHGDLSPTNRSATTIGSPYTTATHPSTNSLPQHTESGQPLGTSPATSNATDNINGNSTTSNANSNATSSPIAGEEEVSDDDDEEVVLPGLYLTETYSLMHDRWNKLYKDFFNSKTKQFDLTKVPDVYDMVRYDVLHNYHVHLQGMEELFTLSSVFESCVVPQEYGIDRADKKYIAAKMCGALVEKIKHDLTVASACCDDPLMHPATDDRMLYQLDHSHADDLQINSLERCVRTRLYFTSESHIHSVLNVLRYLGIGSHSLSTEALDQLEQIIDVSYLSQIVIRLFEDRAEANHFTCEVSFSSGTTNDPISDKTNALTPSIVLQKHIQLEDLLGLLNNTIDMYHSDWNYSSTASGASVANNEVKTPSKLEVTATENAEVIAEASVGADSSAVKKNLPIEGRGLQHSKASDSVESNPSLFADTQRFVRSPSARHVETSSAPRLVRNESYTVNIDMKNTSDKWERENEVAVPMVYHPTARAHGRLARHHSSSHATKKQLVSKDDMEIVKPIQLPNTPTILQDASSSVAVGASTPISSTAVASASVAGSCNCGGLAAAGRSLSSPSLQRSRSHSIDGCSHSLGGLSTSSPNRNHQSPSAFPHPSEEDHPNTA